MRQLVSIFSIFILVGCNPNQGSKYSRGETVVDTTVTASSKHGSASASIRTEVPDGYNVDYSVEVESRNGYSSSKSSATVERN